MVMGMKSFSNVCSTYDHVFSWMTIIIACVVVDDAHWMGWINYDKVCQGSKIVFHDKDINLPPSVAKEKVGTFLWVSLFKTIVAIVSWKISWVVEHSLPHGHQSKCTPKSSMGCPH